MSTDLYQNNYLALTLKMFEVRANLNALRSEVLSKIHGIADTYLRKGNLPITFDNQKPFKIMYHDTIEPKADALCFYGTENNRIEAMTAIQRQGQDLYFLDMIGYDVDTVEKLDTQCLINILLLMERLENYSSIGEFSEGYATATLKSTLKQTVIGKTLLPITAMEFDNVDISTMEEYGWSIVERDGRYNLLTEKGDLFYPMWKNSIEGHYKTVMEPNESNPDDHTLYEKTTDDYILNVDGHLYECYGNCKFYDYDENDGIE